MYTKGRTQASYLWRSFFALLMSLALASASQAQLANTKIAFASDRDGNQEIYVMSVDGTSPVRLTNNVANDAQPSWAPDGTKIAFVSNRDGNGDIYVMNADGTNQTRLINTAANAQPSWSPDGTKIAFLSRRDGNLEIYVMNADGTNIMRLTNHPANEYSPTWSPDGAKIAFTSEREGNGDIYVMNADGTNQIRLTPSRGYDSTPSWSPDGTKIAFHSDQVGNGEIYVMNADGTNPIRLTNNPAVDLLPSWSPDGTKIAFTSKRDGNEEIYMMNADGTNPIRLTNNPAIDREPSWSPFLVAVPPIPTLISPDDASTLSTLTPRFQWNVVTSATSYTLEIAFDKDFSTQVTTQTLIATEYMVASGLLSDKKTYYWRVRASNATGAGEWSTPRSFTVQLSGEPHGEEITDDFLNEVFEEAARTYNIPSNLLRAIAYEESRWVQSAKSPDGGVGIMQLTGLLETAAKLIKTEPAKLAEVSKEGARANIMGAAAILRDMFDHPSDWTIGGLPLVEPGDPPEALETWWWIVANYNGGGADRKLTTTNYPFRVYNWLRNGVPNRIPKIDISFPPGVSSREGTTEEKVNLEVVDRDAQLFPTAPLGHIRITPADFKVQDLVLHRNDGSIIPKSGTPALVLTYNQIDTTSFPIIVSYETVTDSQGQSLTNLTVGNFRLREDSTDIPSFSVKAVGGGGKTIAVTLSLDRSESMKEELADAKAAANLFIDQLAPNDQAAVVSFDNVVTVNQPLTTDKKILKAAVNQIIIGDKTAIYDAIVKSVDQVRTASSRQAVILLTDGKDNSSSNTLDQAVNYANRYSVPVYTIGLSLEIGSLEEQSLQQTAEKTGGQYIRAATAAQMVQIYKTISQQLTNQYEIQYTSPRSQADGTTSTVYLTVTFNGRSDMKSKTFTRPGGSDAKVTFSAVEKINPSQLFTVGVRVEGVRNLAGFQLDVLFNKAVLEATKVEEGDFLKGGGAKTFWQSGNIDNAQGTISGVLATRLGTNGVDGAGTLLTITFKAKANGESPLELRDLRLGDPSGNSIPYQASVGQITVILSCPPWDVNCDGKVDIADLIGIAQHLGQKPPQNPRADVNTDGSVNILDLIIVAQHFGESINAAPAAPQMPSDQHDVAMLERWLIEARAANDGSELFRRGIAVLESLLNAIVPEKTALFLNYPNPFNPETWIPYQLNEASEVTLTIYDALGRPIKRLDLGYQLAGIYRTRARAAHWDGRNDVGEPVASGIYFVELRTNKFQQTRRIVLLK